MAHKKNKVSAGKVAAIGAGMAAVSAGAYYLLGPDGKKHQKDAKGMMKKMEKELENKIMTPGMKKTEKMMVSKAKAYLGIAEKKVAKATKVVKKTEKKVLSKANKALTPKKKTAKKA